MRYATDNSIKISEVLYYDAVIVGAGLAGLYTALNIDENFSCCIITKEDLSISNSWLAQGGIAAAISTDDDPKFHYQDTLIAGAGLCDEAAVRILVDEGPMDVKKLISMNVPFDLNADGDLQITREGGHHRNRIVHAGGDATGREAVKALSYIVAERDNVTFSCRTFFSDVITDASGCVSGVLVRNFDQKYRILVTQNVVIATGGIGQVYTTSTNPTIATGDGIAAAIRAGAKLKNMEFIQFHPTGLWSAEHEERSFLISEAVRGEGGLLKNKAGERFMYNQHELHELAPRDIVARGIVRELENSGEDHVFVDITSKSEEFLRNRFPTIFNECYRRGINISKEWIPVCPVQHYLIGGIITDLNGQTNVPGLYACGEAAYTGVHGANRLASNSMLECLVFGRRAAVNINNELAAHAAGGFIVPVPDFPSRPSRPTDYNAVRRKIQILMNDNCGVIRNEASMEETLLIINDILNNMENEFTESREYVETLNIAMIAREILTAALARKESVGAHYRES